MKFLDPSSQVLLPVVISVRADTAQILSEMALEMESSLDEVLSDMAEDAAACLGCSSIFLEDVVIPDRCSTEDLLKSLEK